MICIRFDFTDLNNNFVYIYVCIFVYLNFLVNFISYDSPVQLKKKKQII